MFNRFYDSTVEESGSLTEEPKLPRVRKVPRRIDHGSHHLHTYTLVLRICIVMHILKL